MSTIPYRVYNGSQALFFRQRRSLDEPTGGVGIPLRVLHSRPVQVLQRPRLVRQPIDLGELFILQKGRREASS
jgi:hypothetical protein